MKTLATLILAAVLQIGCSGSPDSKTGDSSDNKKSDSSESKKDDSGPTVKVSDPVVDIEKQNAAVAEIKKLKGSLWFDEDSPGKPVVAVRLNSPQANAAGLVHLKEMTKLGELDLSETKVTDAGVTELQTALPKCKIVQ